MQGYLEKDGFEKVRFCPISTERKEIAIQQLPDGTFTEEAMAVDGQLLLFVKMPGNDKRRIGPWPIKNGVLPGNMTLTAGMFFVGIHKEIREELPCCFDPPVELEVTGYFKFDSDPLHIVKLNNTIKYTLTTIPKPQQ